MKTAVDGGQRVRESNPCTSLERAVVFPRIQIVVAISLLDSAAARPASTDRSKIAFEGRMSTR